MENNEVNIYSMQLHEVIGVNVTSDGFATPIIGVLRVPSGWIYMFWDECKQSYVREVFVPYSS